MEFSPSNTTKTFSMSTILLTGAAGFIGTETARLLTERGHTVIGLDNFNDYYAPELKRYRANSLKPISNFQLIEGDIRDGKLLDTLFQQYNFDAVINLAAMAGVRYSIEQPLLYTDVNATGFLQLLEAMRKHGVTQIVQASTSSLYAGLPMPFKEELDVRTPISPYAASKLGAEAMGYTYSKLHGFNVTVLRYFTVYGPAGRPDMAPYRFTEWCLRNTPIQLFGDGTQSRDFTYVTDIAAGTVKAVECDLDGFHIINLGGGGNRTTILEFIETIGELSGSHPKIDFLPVVQADMQHTSASIEKAHTLLDWTPKVSIDEGMEKLVRWHMDHRDLLSGLNF